MVEALKITREMKESREEKVDEIVSRINKNIKYAAAHGEHRAFFDCGKDNMIEAPFYAEVRARFEKAGYRIVPTGYIGGVWQRTEDIEW